MKTKYYLRVITETNVGRSVCPVSEKYRAKMIYFLDDLRQSLLGYRDFKFAIESFDKLSKFIGENPIPKGVIK